MSTRHARSTAILVAALLVVLVGGLPAEESPPPFEAYPQALGGFFGPISGTGLHYHRWVGRDAFSIAGGIIYVPYDDTDPSGFYSSVVGTTLDYTIGAEYQRRVYGEAFTNWLAGSLYLFAGGRHRGYQPIVLVSGTPYDYETDPPVYGVGTYQAEVSAGFGIGVEVILFRHFSLPLEFGYGATWTMTEPDLAAAFVVEPLLQSGLRYRY